MAPGEAGDAYYEGGILFKPGFGSEEWEALKQRLPVSSIITGKVVHQAPFGVFIDAGLGFPVLMRVAEFRVIKPSSLAFSDDYPALGEAISGQFCGFNERNRQLDICRLGLKIVHPDADSNGFLR
jgi:ribosomal protein S1